MGWGVTLLGGGGGGAGGVEVGDGSGSGRGRGTGSSVCWEDLVGSGLFVMAMCFKQIALYYAPAFFFYLLGRCLQGPSFLRAAGACALKLLVR